ncbi:MAG: TldD/PmbA family protein [Oligoflexia bacterium]|nr:TldD/PmbA family protein [Oligoflexia bacterium]
MSKHTDSKHADSKHGLDSLLDLGQRVVSLARELGADQVRAGVGRGVSTELSRRDGHIEKAEKSRSLSVRASIMVDGRFSAHATSDLRPEALREFLGRAVEATRFLEPDLNRRLPDLETMGDADIDALDMRDASWDDLDPAYRQARCADLEDRVRAAGSDLKIRSVTTYAWDGSSDHVTVTSHGYQSAWRSTSFGGGAVISLEDEGGRLPEAYFTTGARHQADQLGPETIAKQVIEHGRHRLGGGPTASGRYAMLVENKVAGRILGTLIGPMHAEAIYEKRSCLDGKLGQRVANEALTIIDDPLLPRAAGSHPHDGDGMPARRRTLLDRGVLQEFLVDVYNGRRLGWEPTSGDVGNLIVPQGVRSPQAVLATLPQAIVVEGFLGGNTNPASGDFSFGVNGVLYQHGHAVRNISEMNISGNLFELLDRFSEACDDAWIWSTWRTPSLLFHDIQFSGS